MTVLLVLLTLILFLLIDFLFRRQREMVRQTGTVSGLVLPEGLRLATNHTWIRPDPDGNILVGIDQILAGAAGKGCDLQLPSVKSLVTPAHWPIVIRHGRRRLVLQSPVAGEIVGINESARLNPGLITNDPYGQGWLLRIRKGGQADESDSYLVTAPARWLKNQLDEVVSFLTGTPGPLERVTVQDGGVLIDGYLRSFGADVWTEFNSRFGTLQRESDSER